MRVLITRPKEDAQRIAEPLRARGVDVLLEPMLEIVEGAEAKAHTPAELQAVQALVFSSANGVRAFAHCFPDPDHGRDLTIYAVGDTTARVATEAGFTTVFNAEGDVTSLAALIRRMATSQGGPLIHVTSNASAGNLAGALAPDGFDVRRWELYRSKVAERLSAPTRRALKKGRLDAVFLYSPRTTATFARLVREAGLTDTLAGVTAYALSPAVAKGLSDLPLAAVRTAVQPSQDSLLSLFDADQAVRGAPPAPSQATSVRPTRQGGLPVMTERSKDDHVETPKGAAASPGGLPQSGTPAWGGSAAPNSGPSPKDQPWTGPGAGGGGGGGRIKPTASPEYREKKRQKKGGGCLLMTLLVLLIVFSALSLPGSWSYWRHQMPDEIKAQIPDLPNTPDDPVVTALTAENAGLVSQVAALEGQVAGLESALAEVREVAENAGVVIDMTGPLDDAASAYLNQQLEDLADKMEVLRGAMVSPANVLSLSDRLTEVEAIARQTHTRRNAALALLLAVGQLREAVDRGDAFSDELNAVAAIAEDAHPDFAPLLTTLQPYADSGIQSRVALRARFGATANAVTRAVAAPKTDSWVDRSISALAEIVTIRRVDDGSADETSPMVLLARAEARVRNNDLAGAAMVLDRLEGEAAEAAKPWTEAVAAKMVAEVTLSDLTSLAVAEIGAARASEPGSAQNTEG